MLRKIREVSALSSPCGGTALKRVDLSIAISFVISPSLLRVTPPPKEWLEAVGIENDVKNKK